MLSFADVRTIFSEVANIYIEARRAQVDALNIHKFSDGEYIMGEAARLRSSRHAGGQRASTFRRSNTWRARARRESSTKLPDMPMPEVPKPTSSWSSRTSRRLKEWLPMAVLGL